MARGVAAGTRHFEETAYAHLDPLTFTVSVKVDRAISHRWYEEFGLLMWMTFEFPIHDDHRAYVEKRKKHKDVELIVNSFTLFAHESRHFHDLLATPYGSYLMGAQTDLALSMLEFREHIRRHHNAIAVPLFDWISSGDLLRRAFRQIEAPSPEVQTTAARLEEVLSALQRANSGWVNRDPLSKSFLDATAILEGSAVLHQEREIVRNFGVPVGEFFRIVMRERPSAATYYSAIEFAHKCTGGRASNAAISYILLGSLCGDRRAEDLQAPADLLGHFGLWIQKRGIERSRFETIDGTVEVVNEFFDDVHHTTIEERLAGATTLNAHALEVFQHRVELLEERAQRGLPGARHVLRGFENYAEVQRWFARSVFSDPEWYCTSDYHICKRGLPSCVIILQSDTGIPITDALENYEVLSGSLVPIPASGKPEDFREEPDAPGQTMVAHALSVRKRYIDRETSPVGSPPSDDPPDIDQPLWHSRYLELAGLKLYLDGPAVTVSDSDRDMEVSVLNQFGTRVFSSAGELEARAIHGLEISEDVQKWLDDIKANKAARGLDAPAG
jgi:hypothetical protein